ncbi:MAG: hypothetical protein AVDCRST_MAG76-3713, partial [uncultured Acidimicrobiales bacterium]
GPPPDPVTADGGRPCRPRRRLPGRPRPRRPAARVPRPIIHHPGVRTHDRGAGPGHRPGPGGHRSRQGRPPPGRADRRAGGRGRCPLRLGGGDQGPSLAGGGHPERPLRRQLGAVLLPGRRLGL